VIAPDLGYDAYMDYMGVDQKVEAGRIRFVLFKQVGGAFISGPGTPNDYDPNALRGTLTEAVSKE
jgi:3-dehydroquinate synthase